MKPSILIVDDSLTFRETLAGLLEERGHAVHRAGSGEEGLRLAASLHPAAFVVDGILPGIDGAAFIRRIRLENAFRSAPCVLLTGTRAEEAEVQALESGADAFVRKDDDIEVILAKLATVFRTIQQATPVAGTLRPKQLLLVDDSRTYLNALTDALADDGHAVLQASNGKEALDIVASHAVDCILLDLVMPEMDGKETCRHLKSSPTTQDIPVIVLTSVESRDAMLEGLALGADDYIQKSAEIEVLKARVRAQLRRRQVEEQARHAREELLKREHEEREARAALQLAETRARLVHALEEKNAELSTAYAELQSTQVRLIHAAKMVSLGELVAGVAHEINNPLAFALSHLTTAKRDLAQCESIGLGLSPEGNRHWQRANERLGQMNEGLERIRELVVKLRTFSRLDEGTAKKVVSIKACIDSVLMILQHRVKVGVSVTRRDAEPDSISCFPGPLNQAVMNIVSNAIDAIGQEGHLDIETRWDGSDMVIAVSDDGPGIPEHLRDRVMEPFFTTKDVGQGTGLGLSITYSIAHMHGGDFSLDNRPEGGARATLRIPAGREGVTP